MIRVTFEPWRNKAPSSKMESLRHSERFTLPHGKELGSFAADPTTRPSLPQGERNAQIHLDQIGAVDPGNQKNAPLRVAPAAGWERRDPGEE